MVIGASVFGYVVANVSNLIGNSNFIEKKAVRKISLIKEFLKLSKCSKRISNDIIEFFRQSAKLNSDFDHKEMFDRLPMKMKNEMLLMGQMDVIVNIPIFHYIKNISIKLHLLDIMVAHVAVTGRSIIREGDIGTKILFLVEGSASVFKAVIDGKSNNNNNKNINNNKNNDKNKNNNCNIRNNYSNDSLNNYNRNNNNKNNNYMKMNARKGIKTKRAKNMQDENKNKIIKQFQMTLRLLKARKQIEKEKICKSLSNNISVGMSVIQNTQLLAEKTELEVNNI